MPVNVGGSQSKVLFPNTVQSPGRVQSRDSGEFGYNSQYQQKIGNGGGGGGQVVNPITNNPFTSNSSIIESPTSTPSTSTQSSNSQNPAVNLAVKTVTSVPSNAQIANADSANAVYYSPSGTATYYNIPTQATTVSTTPSNPSGPLLSERTNIDYQQFQNNATVQFTDPEHFTGTYKYVNNNGVQVPITFSGTVTTRTQNDQNIAKDIAYDAITKTSSSALDSIPSGATVTKPISINLDNLTPDTPPEKIYSGGNYILPQTQQIPTSLEPYSSVSTTQPLQAYSPVSITSTTSTQGNQSVPLSVTGIQSPQFQKAILNYLSQKSEPLQSSTALDQSILNKSSPTISNPYSTTPEVSYSQYVPFGSSSEPYGVSGQSYIPILTANDKLLAATIDAKIFYDRLLTALNTAQGLPVQSNKAIGEEFALNTPKPITGPLGSVINPAVNFALSTGESAAYNLNPLNLPLAFSQILNPEFLSSYINQLEQTAVTNPAIAAGQIYGTLLGGYAGGKLLESASSIPVIREVPTPLPPEAIDILKQEGLTSPQALQEAALSNPSEFPSATTFSLKLGEREVPIVSKVTGGTPIQVGSAIFENPESIAVSKEMANINNANPISEGTPTLVKSYIKNLEAATGSSSWQTQYAKLGLDLAGTIKDAKLPATASGLHLEGFTPNEDAIINTALANPQELLGPDANGRVYGTASVQFQLGSDFRVPHDIDFKITTDTPELADVFAQKITNALNANGEGKYLAKDNIVYDMQGEGTEGAKIMEIKTNVPRPEDIEGALQQVPGLKLGFNAERGTVVTPQGTQIAPIGETVLGKLSSALGIRWEINADTGEPEITLNSALKRGDASGSKDVADSVAIMQRYTEAVPDPVLAAKVNQFKDIAIEHGLVTQAKIDESLNTLDSEGLKTSYTPPQITKEQVLPISQASLINNAIESNSSAIPINSASVSGSTIPISNTENIDSYGNYSTFKKDTSSSSSIPTASSSANPSISKSPSIVSSTSSAIPSPYSNTSQVSSSYSSAYPSPYASSFSSAYPSLYGSTTLSPSLYPSLYTSIYPSISPSYYSPYKVGKRLGIAGIPAKPQVKPIINPAVLKLIAEAQYKPSLYSLLFPEQSIKYPIPEINSPERGISIRPFSTNAQALQYKLLGEDLTPAQIAQLKKEFAVA